MRLGLKYSNQGNPQEGSFASPGNTEGTTMDDFPTPRRGNRQNVELNERCPIRDVLDRVGDKWSALIVRELHDGPRRFGALRRAIEDISQRMLTETLRNLQRDGFITRTVIPTTPPQVEYALTPLGHSLQQALGRLAEWSAANHGAIRSARQQFDAVPLA
jgi:DNA-binding HxlR family transcriptional regulator